MSRLTRNILVALFIVFVAALVALGATWLHYDRIVAAQFEGRRWTLPAKVYAAPLELYAGLSLDDDELVEELERLRYSRTDELARSGTWRRRNGRIEIAARAARFPGEERPATIVSVGFSGGSVSGLRNAHSAEVPVFRLDPLLIGSIFPTHGEDRIVLAPDEVPALLPKAIKAVEDRRFDSHNGLDFEAIGRAMLANLRAGRIRQGGSTLTQQLVKSYFLDHRRTWSRKFREALMAIALERRYTKADLMNSYINEIWLGQEGQRAIHGFGLASQFYFAKPVSELELSEIALLVALARGPSYYDPRRHPERALERRDLVLRLLVEQGIVDEARAGRASGKPLGVTERTSGGYYPAYLDFVRRTLRRDYRDEDLTESGLSIYTSFDARAQGAAEKALAQELTRLDAPREDAPGEQLEGAIVIASPQSNEVVALVGGRRAGFDGFNRALDARRPIGSLVKPFVYLAAFETGRYDAATIVNDEPVEVRLSRTQTWRPQNYTRRTYGPVPVVRALGDSLNLATVHVGLDVGVERVAAELEQLGLPEAPTANPALLLGALDLAPLDVAQLYNALANGGFNSPLRAVRAVLDAEGKPLSAYPVDVTPVASPEVVYQVDRMLTQVVEHGTSQAARSALPASLMVAGKTGSSSDLRDSWFAGFSGTHLAVVWMGYDDNHPTGVTGSGGALRVWSRILANLDTQPWPAFPPESIEEITVDYATGLRVDATCDRYAEPSRIAIPRERVAEVPWMAGCAGAVDNPANAPGAAGETGQTAGQSGEGVAGRVSGWVRGMMGR